MAGLVLGQRVDWRQLPFDNGKLLQLPPALGGYQCLQGPAEGITTIAPEIGLVALGINNPVEDVVGENLVAQ